MRNTFHSSETQQQPLKPEHHIYQCIDEKHIQISGGGIRSILFNFEGQS